MYICLRKRVCVGAHIHTQMANIDLSGSQNELLELEYYATADNIKCRSPARRDQCRYLIFITTTDGVKEFGCWKIGE